MSGAPNFDERLTSATSSSDLSANLERRGDVDLLIAAGKAPLPLGRMVYRLMTEWDGTVKPRRLDQDDIRRLAESMPRVTMGKKGAQGAGTGPARRTGGSRGVPGHRAPPHPWTPQEPARPDGSACRPAALGGGAWHQGSIAEAAGRAGLVGRPQLHRLQWDHVAGAARHQRAEQDALQDLPRIGPPACATWRGWPGNQRTHRAQRGAGESRRTTGAEGRAAVEAFRRREGVKALLPSTQTPTI